MCRALAIGVLWAGVLGAPLVSVALEIPPPPPRFVHDSAGVLTPGDKRALEERLLALQRERGLEIAVAIFPSLGGDPLEDATMRIVEAWRPGRKDKDEGVLVALFMAERKLRIEVGYGLEAKIPDVVAGRIIRNVMVPEMRAGRPAAAIAGAVETLVAVASGEKLPQQARRKKEIPPWVLMLLVFGVFSVVSRLARTQARRGRGLGRHSAIPWWIALGGGGGRGSGGSSGGSFGGGSFGGGSFGGGGASGGW